MRNSTYKNNKENTLSKIFEYMMEIGLENISVRELCKETGISMGSIYYWFDNKKQMICDASEYGLKKAIGEIFEFVSGTINKPDIFFEDCIECFDKQAKPIRFITQMAASPVYGKMLRENTADLDDIYEEYIQILASITCCEVVELRPIIHMLVSTILDYVVWGNKKIILLQLEYIHSLVKNLKNK